MSRCGALVSSAPLMLAAAGVVSSDGQLWALALKFPGAPPDGLSTRLVGGGAAAAW